MWYIFGILYILYVWHSYMKFDICYEKKDILLVSDSIHICGVTRKYNEIYKRLIKDYKVIRLDSSMFKSYSVPIWNDVKICIPDLVKYLYIREIIKKNKPDKIHIMTEGPLGFLTKMYCVNNRIEFTSMFCTRIDLYFDQNINKYIGNIVRFYLKNFHKHSKCIITPSPSMIPIIKYMTNNNNIKCIFNGCDLQKFSILGDKDIELKNIKGPIWLYVGRLCKSKGIQDLLNISHKLPGTVVIVGGGQHFLYYKNKYRHVKFLGWKENEELYNCYRSADYFVFPSKTDTFGQVMVEAMATGLPVAAYPVTGPQDIILNGKTGILDNDLYTACMNVIKINNNTDCINHSKKFTWDNMINEFINTIYDI